MSAWMPGSVEAGALALLPPAEPGRLAAATFPGAPLLVGAAAAAESVAAGAAAVVGGGGAAVGAAWGGGLGPAGTCTTT